MARQAVTKDDINTASLDNLKRNTSANKILIIGISNDYAPDVERFKNYKAIFGQDSSLFAISTMKNSLATEDFATFNLDLTLFNDIDYLRQNFSNIFSKILFDRGTVHHLLDRNKYENFTHLTVNLYNSLVTDGILYLPYVSKLDVDTNELKQTINQIQNLQIDVFRLAKIRAQYKDLAQKGVVKYFDYDTYLGPFMFAYANKSPQLLVNQFNNIVLRGKGYELDRKLITYPPTLLSVDKPYFNGKFHDLNYDVINIHNMEVLYDVLKGSKIELVNNNQYTYKKQLDKNDEYCKMINYHSENSIHTYYLIRKSANLSPSDIYATLTNYIDTNLPLDADAGYIKATLQSYIESMINESDRNRQRLTELYYNLNVPGAQLSNRQALKKLISQNLNQSGGSLNSYHHKYLKYKHKYLKTKL